MAPFKVIVIGAGLAGGLLSNGLLHNNVDFTVYESDERDSKREGYQIRLGSPALVGFKACLTQDQQATLYKMFGRSGGMISSAPILYDTQLNKLLDLTRFPAYTKSAPINRVLLRSFFQEPLDAAGRIQFNKRFQSYEILPQSGDAPSRVRVSFRDGTTDECDLLISAEGSVSKVNTQIGLNNIVQLRGRWGFLAKGNLPVEKLMRLTPEVRQAPMMVIKDGIVLFYSAYLPDGFRTKNPDAKPGEADYDEDLASLFWGLQIPKELCPEDPRKLENKIEFCLDKIKTWDPRFNDMLRAIDNDVVHVFQGRASSKPSKNWRSQVKQTADSAKGNDHVWLLGDSIHPMLPSRGMGGNQAMNDTADMLPRILELAEKSAAGQLREADYSTAVQVYEAAMIPRAFKWVATSGGTGGTLHEPTSFMGRISLFFIARLLDLAFLFTLVRQLFGWKVKDDAPELPN